MHQKKSQVVQIGKESSGISSDFNPFSCSSLNPPFPPQVTTSTFTATTTAQSSSSSSSSSSSVPYKRSLLTQTTSSLAKSPTLYNLTPTPHFPSKTKTKASNNRNNRNVTTSSFSTTFQLPAIRGLRLHVTISISSFVLFYLVIISRPNDPALLDFLSAVTAVSVAAAAVLISLQLALPRLPAIRPFLNCPCSRLRRRPLPVFWAAGGSNPGSAGGGGDGLRVQVYSNGDVYQGEFRQGKCWGSGVYYYSMSGGRYEGDWVDGKYEGFGVETWARGSRYRGQFRIGLRHGFGVYRFYTGDVYAGEWASGQSHGCGVHTCDDGSKFVGEFKWGVKHGLGHYHFRNGDTYAGEYFADKMHGFGVYCFANGHLYEGAWHEGKRQGLGMYTFGNGETQSGHWQNGVLHIPSTQNASYPVSPVGVNHSKVLNAVQEARRAAEKAYDVAKVDERVNRAVAAANRAANAARVAAVKAMQKQMHHNVNSESIAIPVV